MNFNIKNRFLILGIVLIGMFAVLFVQLIKLTLVKGADYAAAANALKTEAITVSGARGNILDRKGLPLAYDQKSFNVQFYRDPTKTSTADKAYYTDIITKTIKLIEDNGGKSIDTFAIKFNSDTGVYYFDWGDITKKQAEDREKIWKSNMYIDIKDQSLQTPEQIYLKLRDRYQIPSEVGYEDARKILSIWQEVQLASWKAFNPVVIAYNVSTQTVAKIETYSNLLTGMSIVESTTRIYPRGTLAAHIIGYMSRIPKTLPSDQLKALEDKGYSDDDLVGVEGIEKTMESYLTGNTSDRQGTKQVEVDNKAVVKNVLSSTQPKQGDNVVLTIDVPLQQAVEESLAKNIAIIKQHELTQYDTYKDKGGKRIGKKAYKGLDVNKMNLANSGAAIVLDVNTGEVLAMASYPSYDLNLFTGGISDKDYTALQKDPAAPLFNKAILSRDTPGSIFKMVTGLAGLMEGKLGLHEEISDLGEYTPILTSVQPGQRAPVCWKYPYVSAHKNQDIVLGLTHSCDYFFYEVANRLGIDLLDKWGEKFGLASSTGIELPGEAVGHIGNQKTLYDNSKSLKDQSTYIPYLVKYGQKYGLIKLLKGYAEKRNVRYNDSVYSKTADDLIALAGLPWAQDASDKKILKYNNVSIGDYVRQILNQDMQIRPRVSVANHWGEDISSLLSSNLIWTPYYTVTTGIGQGVVQVTPIALARYVAAIANGGTVYETHVVKKIVDQSGQVVFEQQPVVYDTLGAPKEYLDALKKGMANVVQNDDGTANSYFENFDYKNKIAGKTGTAQVSNIDLEDNGWFVCIAPYDQNDESVKPEIAIVVYVPHGLSGGETTQVAKDIIQFYLDREQVVAKQDIPASNSIVGG